MTVSLPQEIPLEPLLPDFYKRDTATVARELLGKVLLKKNGDAWVGGVIVETEAYLGKDDPSCHAARGRTAANAAMFGPPGRAYVYFTYGMYHCFNAVAYDPAEDRAGAVLVRALHPLWGVEVMQERRRRQKHGELCSGPGKLCIALDLTKADNGRSLSSGELLISSGGNSGEPIETDVRIGISSGIHMPLRFFYKNNPFVSRKTVKGR